MKKKVKKIIWIIIALLLIGAASFAVAMKNRQPAATYTAVAVARADVEQTVAETGTVKSAEEINLSFQRSGKILAFVYKVGDKAAKDAVIAELECADLLIKKNEAEAVLEAAQASHAKLLSGSTPEEINVAKASLQQAKIAYETAEKELLSARESADESVSQAKKNLSDLESSGAADVTATEQAVANASIALDNSKLTYQSALDNYYENAKIIVEDKLSIGNNALDEIDRTINDDDLEDNLSLQNLTYLQTTQTEYAAGLSLLDAAKKSLESAKADDSRDNIAKMLADAKRALSKIFSALKNCYSALEFSIVSADVTQSELDAFKASISADQTLAAAAISSVQAAEQNINTATINYDTNVSTAENSLKQAKAAYDDALKNARNALSTATVSSKQQTTAAQSKTDAAFEAWLVAQSRYEQTAAPAGRNDILASGAKIKQAQASLRSIEQSIDDCRLKAPTGGLITKVNYEAGEQAQSGSPAVSMIGENGFEIEVLISEADIAKVKKGDPAKITLDAFGEDTVFSGSVYFIEPASTVIQEVIYYKVKAVFSQSKEEDPRLAAVKSGMTANLSIATDSRSNVLAMPLRAVIDRNGSGKWTRVLHDDNTVEERQITLGLVGDSGFVEVLSGLKEGERVVTYVNK